jgi:DNA-binding SARP family transcriptional activator
MINLQLFGRPVLRCPECVGGAAAQRRRMALLALLAVSRGGMSRDKLIALLWPDADAERSRHLLSNSVYVLRQALGGEVVLAGADGLRLNSARIRCDVSDFLDALERGEDAVAVGYCTAPFLDGFFVPRSPEFEHWVECQRERLARALGEALERLGEHAEVAHDLHAAAGWWRQLAEADPYGSRTALRLMQSLVASGEPAAAIQHARRHEKRLRQDLDLDVSPAMTQLMAQLCQDHRRRSPA